MKKLFFSLAFARSSQLQALKSEHSAKISQGKRDWEINCWFMDATREREGKLFLQQARAHSNFPISNSLFVRNIESTGAEQQKKFSIFWDTWMMTKCSGETMI